MSRNCRFLVAAAVVSLTSPLSLSGVAVDAVAAPAQVAPTLEQVKADVARIEDQSKVIEEEYNTKALALEAAYASLQTTSNQVAAQQSKVKQLDGKALAVLDAVLASYSTKGVDATVVREYSVRADRLSELTRARDARAKAVADGEKKLADLAARGDATAREGDHLMLTLTPENRTALEQAEAAERDASAASAADQQVALEDAARVAQQPVRADRLAGSAEATGAESLSLASNVRNARLRKVVSYALSRVGRSQYVWGAEGPWRFDCSGLMLAAYRQAGVKLPHSSRLQAKRGRWVSRYSLKAGDLVFYYSPISHVALYAGSGYIVHARNTRVDIVLQKFKSYPAKYNTARRIVG